MLPESGPTTLRIVGFDPGTAHLGVAVLDWVWGDPLPVVVYANTFHAKDETHDSSMAEIIGKRDCRMRTLRAELQEILPILEPHFAITETPFMQRGKLSAYESGVEIQLMLRECLWEYSPRIPLNGINPKTLKNHLGVVHVGTDKSDMYRAVLKVYGKSTIIDLTELDEHSIDAIGACNFFWRAELMNLPSLITPAPKKPKKKSSGKKRRGKKRKKK
jgi:hypothetical protein